MLKINPLTTSVQGSWTGSYVLGFKHRVNKECGHFLRLCRLCDFSRFLEQEGSSSGRTLLFL